MNIFGWATRLKATETALADAVAALIELENQPRLISMTKHGSMTVMIFERGAERFTFESYTMMESIFPPELML